jgi:hypothetical protein
MKLRLLLKHAELSQNQTLLGTRLLVSLYAWRWHVTFPADPYYLLFSHEAEHALEWTNSLYMWGNLWIVSTESNMFPVKESSNLTGGLVVKHDSTYSTTVAFNLSLSTSSTLGVVIFTFLSYFWRKLSFPSFLGIRALSHLGRIFLDVIWKWRFIP